MDLDSPVAAGIQGPNLSSLSDIVNLYTKKQALQTGAYQQQAAKAESEQAQQKNSELQAVGNLTKNAYTSGRYKKDDGSFDNQRFADDVSQVAPTYGQSIANDATTRAGEIYRNQQTLFSLNADRRKQIGNALGTLAAQVDSDGKPTATHDQVIDTIEQLRQQNPNDKDYGRMLTSMAAGIDPRASGQQLQQTLRNMALMTNAPSSTQTDQSMGTTQGRNGLQAINTNPQAVGGVGPRGASIHQGVAPGANLVKDMSGAQFILDPQTNTIRPVGTGQKSNANGFKQPSYVGQEGDVEANQNEIRGIRSTGDAAPQAHNINDQILRLSKDTNTGPGTAFWRQIPMVGGMFGDDYQELGKYLEKNAINNMSAMGGPPSDARLSAASAANGSTHFNPGALQAVTKFNDATTTGVEKFRRGADAAVGLDNPDYTKLAKFKSDWSKNFDVDVYRYENAMKRGDDDEIKQIESERGKKGMAELLRKRQALETLAKTGRLGQ